MLLLLPKALFCPEDSKRKDNTEENRYCILNHKSQSNDTALNLMTDHKDQLVLRHKVPHNKYIKIPECIYSIRQNLK